MLGGKHQPQPRKSEQNENETVCWEGQETRFPSAVPALAPAAGTTPARLSQLCCPTAAPLARVIAHGHDTSPSPSAVEDLTSLFGSWFLKDVSVLR